MKRISEKVLSLAIAVSIFTVPFSSTALGKSPVFGDIQGHWAQNDIEYLYDAGMVSGVSDKEFAPDSIISKAEFIAMLARSIGLDNDIYSISYSDVSPLDDWFAGYLGAAVNSGIIEDSVHAFNPLMAISRGDAAIMLSKAMKYENIKKSSKSIDFSDVSKEDGELSDAVGTVSSIGIMVGETSDEFAPDATMTRAEAAAVVKRMSLAAGSVGTVNLSTASDSESGDEITLGGGFSSASLGTVDFHYGINKFETSAAVSADGLKLEIWLDSTDTLTGTKVGTVVLEKTASMESAKVQSALINRAYGSREVYVRLMGDGTVKLKKAAFGIDEVPISLTKYSEIYLLKKSGTGITNLQNGGYINFDDVNLGDGYDTVEFTMKNTKAGQLFEVWLDNDKVAVLETEDAQDGSAVISTPVVKAHDTKKLSIRPVTSGEGSITGVRFYNSVTKADIMLDADDAETDLTISKSEDYDGKNETAPMKNGDIIKFSNVNFFDGYNILSARTRKADTVYGLELAENDKAVGEIMGMVFDTSEKGAYIEVRLDSETGPIVGKLEENKIPVNSKYDIQSCYLHGAEGFHDLYLKAVGDVSWNIKYVKLQERGWYDAPFATYEAEDMTVYKGTVTDYSSPERYYAGTITGESSGRANVLIDENGGYVEFTVPEWFEGRTDRTVITVRHSINDCIDESGNSVGRDGKMKISINGSEVKPLDSFNEFKEMDYLTLSNKYSIGYGSSGNGLAYSEGALSKFLLDDAFGVLPGDIKPGDVIRLEPEINDDVTYCYIDCIELETIDEPKTKPERFLSIADCGAVADDGLDDAEALRAAVQKINDNPYTYDGLWIPEGTYDIINYVGDRNCHAASFNGIRVLGSGIWTSRLVNHRHTGTAWAANYTIGEGTVIRDLAFHGQTIARGWNSYGAICLNGKGMNHLENVWIEHYNCGVWVANGSGVYRKVRIKNTWADGINNHNTSDGLVYEKSFGRANGDDPFVIYSASSVKPGESSETPDLVKDVKIKNNIVYSTWHASGITIWGGENIDIMNNLVCDVSGGGGISLNAWGWNTCATNNVWITHNRIERCGNQATDGQQTGAISIVPGKAVEGCNNKYMNTYFDSNEFIDNPYLLMRISSQNGADEVLFDMNYNYARNSCLALPDVSKKRLVEYRNAATNGALNYFYNVYEGDYYKFKTSHTEDVEEAFVGNLPEEWGN